MIPERDRDYDAAIARLTERIAVARSNGETSQERGLVRLRSIIAQAGGRPDPEPEVVLPEVVPERIRIARTVEALARQAIERWAADTLEAIAQSGGDNTDNVRDSRMVKDLAREATERLATKTDPEWWIDRSKHGENPKLWMLEVLKRADLIRLGVPLRRK